MGTSRTPPLALCLLLLRAQGKQQRRMLMAEERGHDFDREAREEGSTPRWLGIAIVVLAAVSLLALGIGWSASSHARSTEQSLNTEVKTLTQSQDALTKRLAQAEDINAQLQGRLNVVTDRLKLTQGELGSARRQTKPIRQEYSKQISAVESSLATKASAEDVKNL